MKKSTFKTWETALLLALAAVLLWGAWTAHTQDALAQKMIRLHVIANSDSAQDQALKLQVRDKVLAQATAILEEAADMSRAAKKLEEALPDMEQIAAQEIRAQGYPYKVSARLEKTEFPTKEYDGFRLPSGEYLALRIVIGEGAGQNWWCVVFPPLCISAAEQEQAVESMSEDMRGIVTEEDGYEYKFRILELWGELMELIGV